MCSLPHDEFYFSNLQNTNFLQTFELGESAKNKWYLRRPVTSLGHQGVEEFSEPKFFKQCLTHFSRDEKFSRDSPPCSLPSYGPIPRSHNFNFGHTLSSVQRTFIFIVLNSVCLLNYNKIRLTFTNT